MALYRHYGLTFYQLLSGMSIHPAHFCELFSVDNRRIQADAPVFCGLYKNTKMNPRTPKPPLVMPRMIRGGGIFEENDGRDLFQASECSELFHIRIPSGPSGQRPYPFWPFGPFPPDRGNRPLVPKGSLLGRVRKAETPHPGFSRNAAGLFFSWARLILRSRHGPCGSGRPCTCP